MPSIRLRFPDEVLTNITLKELYDMLDPTESSLYQVKSIVYLDSKTKLVYVKGDPTDCKPFNGSLTFVICLKDACESQKSIIAKWFVPTKSSSSNIHICNGDNIDLICDIMKWLSKTYVSYDATDAECHIEQVNSKFELQGISQIPLHKVEQSLTEANAEISISYNAKVNPPKLVIRFIKPKFTAAVFRSNIILFLGLKAPNNAVFHEQFNAAIIAFESIFFESISKLILENEIDLSQN